MLKEFDCMFVILSEFVNANRVFEYKISLTYVYSRVPQKLVVRLHSLELTLKKRETDAKKRAKDVPYTWR